MINLYTNKCVRVIGKVRVKVQITCDCDFHTCSIPLSLPPTYEHMPVHLPPHTHIPTHPHTYTPTHTPTQHYVSQEENVRLLQLALHQGQIGKKAAVSMVGMSS